MFAFLFLFDFSIARGLTGDDICGTINPTDADYEVTCRLMSLIILLSSLHSFTRTDPDFHYSKFECPVEPCLAVVWHQILMNRVQPDFVIVEVLER